MRILTVIRLDSIDRSSFHVADGRISRSESLNLDIGVSGGAGF